MTNLAGDAIYFSRCAIPYEREGPFTRDDGRAVHYKHLGLYVYRREFLLAYSGLPVGPLAVSYTHLDVYKRQGQRYESPETILNNSLAY